VSMLSSIFASPGESRMEVLEADDLAELGDPRKLVGERAVRLQFTFHELELGIIDKADQIDQNQKEREREGERDVCIQKKVHHHVQSPSETWNKHLHYGTGQRPQCRPCVALFNSIHRDSLSQGHGQCKATSKQLPEAVITVSSASPSLVSFVLCY
jgi:hypothetical protein